MSGASATHPLVADLAFYYRREVAYATRFAIVGGGTATGLADTARGVVDAGLTDRPRGPGDPPGLQYTPLALSALCLVTNPANPMATVTTADLASVAWAGTEAAGGPFGAPLSRTFARPAQVRDFVLATPTAWGYVDLAFTGGLNLVAYDGIPCSPYAPYPARREFGVVTRGPPRGEVARFLRWVARDATAQRVITTRHVIP